MTSIKENLTTLNTELEGSNTRLVAVSKTKPIELLQEAYDAGIRIFGENKVQEMADKHPQLPQDIEWHMIGHLQTNKVKYLAPFVSMIHAVDSLKLLKEINKRAANADRVINCLLQIHIAEEENKFGLSAEEAEAILAGEELAEMKNICIKGLMGMATNTKDLEQVRKEFRGLKTLFNKLKQTHQADNIDLQEVSMGMSGDYKIAMEEGSTLVRIGSKIFGARQYH